MPPLADIQDIVGTVVDNIINPLFILAFGLATLLFMWGVIQAMMSPDDTEARQNGKQHIIWGIVGAAIMLGTGGIIRLLMSIWK
ncbi:MAG: hypothetical protein AAB417_01430 [Patescibacteria group bacterium]